MNNYANIPQEMRPYNQWIVWRYELKQGDTEPTKVPYNPVTGQKAAVDNPSTWADFNTAINASANYDGIGFVLTAHDDFVFIDLDKTNDNAVLENQKRWYEAFPSYSERSPSSKGAHIICKGTVGGGRRDTAKAIEIYDRLRFTTFTGDVIRNEPIVNCQAQIDALIASLGGVTNVGNITVHDEPQLEADAVVITKGMQAANGAKFSDLFNGHWDRHYPSQSEADFAFINELQWFTKNVEQIERIFYLSVLGQREKALKRPKYVRDMIKRSFDRTPPPIDPGPWQTYAAQVEAAGGWTTLATQTATLGGGLNAGSAAVAGYAPTGFVSEQPPAPIAHVNGHVNTLAERSEIYTFPPGLIGEVAHYIYMNAPRPVPQIALAAAIAFIAGICGRTYQTPTGLALNMYVNVIADTGTGKDAMKSGINALVGRIAKLTPGTNTGAVPAIMQFIGPSEFSSGAALHNLFADRPCFVSVLSEFGLMLQNMNASNANPYFKQLNRKFLTLFTGADRDNVEGESARADKSLSTKAIYRPAFSFAAETTPDVYYQTLTDEMVQNGYVSRILTLPYEGIRVDLNEYRCEPSGELISKLQALVVYCLDNIHQNKPVVGIAFDAEADAAQRLYEKRTTAYINKTVGGVYKQLLNRAHVKVLKLSALNAVARNWIAPTVSLIDWNWAMDMVDYEIASTMKKFESGLTGRVISNDDQKRNDLFKHVVRDYLTLPWHNISTYSSGAQDAQFMHQMGVMTFYYISKRCNAVAFKRSEGNRLLEETIKEFVSRGWLVDYPRAYNVELRDKSKPFRSTGRVLYIAEPDKFIGG